MRLLQKIKKAKKLATVIARHGYNLISLLASVQDAAPKDAFIQEGVNRISYAALYRQALQIAYILEHRYGVKPKQKILLACPNGIAFLSILFALSALGCDITLIHPAATKTSLQGQIQDYDYLIHSGAGTVPDLLPALDIQVLLHQLSAHCPSLSPRKCGSYLSVLSSGSQGMPKRYKRKVKAFTYYRPFRELYTKLRLSEYDTTYIALPFHHGYGLAAVLLSLFLEKKVYCHPDYNSHNILAVATKTPISCWIVVPSMIPLLYTHKDQVLCHTRAIISGGDLLEPLWTQQILQETKVRLYSLYGTSQNGICAIATPEDLRQYPATLGKLIRGTRYKLAALPQEHAESLWLKNAWSTDNPNGGFIDTGDLIRINKEGYLFYEGRRDQMRIVGGKNLYPATIADHIRAFEQVKTVSVSVRKDAQLRSTLHAALEVHPNFDAKLFDQYITRVLPEYTIHFDIIA
ncbi:AMP-binding protein [Taibaiella sp. KBW10]|uniref:AMP-binding protein n=1 Tax=Taibaiella sp. KBW10 TaxID=2153357 RepID=UPI0013155355|nr:AMP-binding protein [Taibaiella sp. KBW10]